jgi:LPXTG-motif cell wall-anchored protein
LGCLAFPAWLAALLGLVAAFILGTVLLMFLRRKRHR